MKTLLPYAWAAHRNVLTKTGEIAFQYSDFPKDTEVKVTVIKDGRLETSWLRP